MTTRTTLLTRLLDLPQRLQAAEEALLEATSAHAQARANLEEREADLILHGAAEGRNEAERKARLTVGCQSHAEELRDRAGEKERAAAQLRCLQAELGALRAASRLLAGFSGEGETDALEP